MKKALWLFAVFCLFVGGSGSGAAAPTGGVGWISWKISYDAAAADHPAPAHVRTVARKLLRAFYGGRAIVYVPYAQANAIFVYSLRYLYDPRRIEKKKDIVRFLQEIGERGVRVESSDFAPFFMSAHCEDRRCMVERKITAAADPWGLSYLYAEAARQFGYPVSAVLVDEDNGRQVLHIVFHRDCAFKERMAKELDHLKDMVRNDRADQGH